MKFTLPPVWAALALAGGLAAPPAWAGGAPAPASVPAAPSVPSRLTATGRAQPIGSQIQVSWLPVPLMHTYKVYRDGKFLALSPRAFLADYGVAAGETHSYTVTSVGNAGEGHPCAPATATVPVGGGSVVYADALENGWSSWSWAACDLGSTAPVRAGSAVRVTAGPWQALYLHHAPLDASPYAAVTFWIHGGTQGGQRLCVKALRNGVPQAAVALGPLPAGRWQAISVPLRDLGVAGAPDLDGLWVQDASGTAQQSFTLDEIALSAAPPAATLPAPPAGLSATPQWAASCPKCGGMAMAHVVLAWSAAPGAASYTVYRDGVKAQDGLAAPGWTDMAVVSGRTYAYTVTATGPGGEGLPSLPAVATAPQPPAGQRMLTAPTNLSVTGVWAGAQTDQLAWSPVPGALSYNVYLYDVPLAKGLTATSYAVSADLFAWGLTYTVTAVDGMGMESLPSAVATAQGRIDPAERPGWMPDAPAVPAALVATPEWNAGAPRIHLAWQGKDTDSTYTVYRDGRQVASGLWGLNYYDADLRPGETHAYSVSGVNVPWTAPVESLPSAPVSASALGTAPAPTGVPVRITNVLPDDDSAVVSFAAVPGAADYRVYSTLNPDSVKYSGGGLSVEMNGLDPAAGADLVVEAVDKRGPFQKMDGAGMSGTTAPGAAQMDGMHTAINGQGDPSNVPLVLASSAPFHVSCRPFALAGDQAFLDTFRDSKPFVPSASIDPAVVNFAPDPTQPNYKPNCGDVQQVENDKWVIRKYHADAADTRQFVMGNHFMDTLYDGGTPRAGGPIHNNNASLVMMPKATADISGGRVLHVTFEVDAHFDGRRWCDLFVGAAGDALFSAAPSKLNGGEYPTTSGNLFVWAITAGYHQPEIIKQGAITPLYDYTTMAQYRQVYWSTPDPMPNGTAQDLDKRHRFDLYLSQTHFRLLENGSVVNDRDFPAGQALPFSKAQVYFTHEVYHTGNDRPELVCWDPADSYWSNYRPWSDERHWDAMGQSVLPAFPALP